MSNEMRVALVCIAKMEERYISEFLAHYINLGFDKVIIGDNNCKNYSPKLCDVVEEFGNCVQVEDLQDKIFCQRDFYQETFEKEKQNYDWIAFFDVDEFLQLNGFTSIKDFLAQEKFNGAECIQVNWRMFDDNNILKYENRPVKKRFTHLAHGTGYSETVKSIYRTTIPYKVNGIHHSSGRRPQHTVDANGRKTIYSFDCQQKAEDVKRYIASLYSVASLDHYHTKTIEEYIYQKVQRGNCAFNRHNRPDQSLRLFFSTNEVTYEKLLYIYKHIDDYIRFTNNKFMTDVYDNMVEKIKLLEEENTKLKQIVNAYKERNA